MCHALPSVYLSHVLRQHRQTSRTRESNLITQNNEAAVDKTAVFNESNLKTACAGLKKKPQGAATRNNVSSRKKAAAQANITGVSEEERRYLHRFLDIVPDSDGCVHGDLNINNIMVQDGECCLIDMGELSTGIAMFDFSRILFSMVYANSAPGEYNGFYKMQSDYAFCRFSVAIDIIEDVIV